MKELITAMAVAISLFLPGFVSNATAESVLYAKSGNVASYYDSDMSYITDEVGPTPFVKVHIKVVQGGRAIVDKDFRVNPEVTMLEPLQKSGQLMSMAFEDWEAFTENDWRLVEAIKRWKQSHK